MFVRNLFFFSIILIILLVTGCSKIRKVTDEITKPSAREVYAREFKKDDSVFQNWQTAYQKAISDSLIVPVPYGEKGRFPSENHVYSYTVEMKEGEKMIISVLADSVDIFIDIFDLTHAVARKVLSNDPYENTLDYAIERSGQYKVIIQPEIGALDKFTILINKAPTFSFPVSGKGNAAILSFWGYERDGGQRSHEGIDIFAARGTPIVAVADGTVSSTGDRGLGGKQVWLRIQDKRLSVYYAHLDSIAVSQGKRVTAGDTLGFVGSTGNAAGGKPHLHFGIYKGYGGAVDPLAFVYRTSLLKPESVASEFNLSNISVHGERANLRLGPATSNAIIGTAVKGDVLIILGQYQDWLHVSTADGMKGFIHKSLVRII